MENNLTGSVKKKGSNTQHLKCSSNKKDSLTFPQIRPLEAWVILPTQRGLKVYLLKIIVRILLLIFPYILKHKCGSMAVLSIMGRENSYTNYAGVSGPQIYGEAIPTWL